jgi:hypothetical protein
LDVQQEKREMAREWARIHVVRATDGARQEVRVGARALPEISAGGEHDDQKISSQ